MWWGKNRSNSHFRSQIVCTYMYLYIQVPLSGRHTSKLHPHHHQLAIKSVSWGLHANPLGWSHHLLDPNWPPWKRLEDAKILENLAQEDSASVRGTVWWKDARDIARAASSYYAQYCTYSGCNTMSPKAPLKFQHYDYKDFMRGHFKINETIRNSLSRGESWR